MKNLCIFDIFVLCFTNKCYDSLLFERIYHTLFPEEEIRISETERLDRIFMDVYSRQAYEDCWVRNTDQIMGWKLGSLRSCVYSEIITNLYTFY